MRHVIRARQRLAGTGAVLLALTSLTAPAKASDAGKQAPDFTKLQQPNPRLTLKVTGTSLRHTLSLLFRKARVNYIIHPEVPLNAVTLDMKDQPLTTVLDTLCKLSAKPITYLYRDTIYRVIPVPVPGNEAKTPFSGKARVNLGLNSMRLGPILALITEQFGLSCSMDPELANIPVTIVLNQPYDVVIETLSKASGKPFHEVAEGNVRHFLPLGKNPPVRPLIQGGEGAPGEKRVTIDYRENISVGSALQLLMRQMKSKFEFHPDLAGATVSIRMEDVPISRALTEIGKASSIPFTYEVKDGVYRFRPVKTP